MWEFSNQLLCHLQSQSRFTAPTWPGQCNRSHLFTSEQLPYPFHRPFSPNQSGRCSRQIVLRPLYCPGCECVGKRSSLTQSFRLYSFLLQFSWFHTQLTQLTQRRLLPLL